jgi:hypothetical protein
LPPRPSAHPVREPAGAGVVSACNPVEANYLTFYNQTAPGSWLEAQPGATHGSYVSIVPGLVDDVPLFCGTGSLAGKARGGSAAGAGDPRGPGVRGLGRACCSAGAQAWLV